MDLTRLLEKRYTGTVDGDAEDSDRKDVKLEKPGKDNRNIKGYLFVVGQLSIRGEGRRSMTLYKRKLILIR